MNLHVPPAVPKPETTTTDTVNPETGVVYRIYANGEEAFQGYTEVKKDNRERNNKNAEIQKKINNEPPFKQAKLKATGQDWRNNRPTGFLSIMIDRIKPPYRQMIDSAKTLTFSSYPGETTPDTQTKTDTFREEITGFYRRWPGFPDFQASILHENVTFGYTAAEYDGEYDPRPRALRQDEVFFPSDCSKDVELIPMWGRIRKYRIYELIPILANPQIYGIEGSPWNLDNLIKVINKAAPITRGWNSDDYARKFQDLLREGSLGSTLTSCVNYVNLGSLAVREPNGLISVFVFSDDDGTEVYTKFDAYDKMADCLSLFSIDVGSGPLMTSRGAGRLLYNTHISVDRARNLIADNCYLNGLMIMTKGDNAAPGPPLKIMHPIAVVSKGYTLEPKAAIPANVEAFITLDKHATNIAEMQVGTFLPGQSGLNNDGEKATATEVSYVASLDAQIREEVLTRYFVQFVQMIDRGQRIICHPHHVVEADKINKILAQVPGSQWADSSVVKAFEKAGVPLPQSLISYDLPGEYDEDSVRCCLRMLQKKLSVADILVLAHSSAADMSPDQTQQYVANLTAVVNRYFGSPMINQMELIKRDITAALGPNAADALVIPQEDNTIAVEAKRQQLIELSEMFDGVEMPVSGRDNHMVHMVTIVEKLQPVIQSMKGTLLPETVKPLELILKHFNDHLVAAKQSGVPEDQLKDFETMAKNAASVLKVEVEKIGQTPATAQPPAGSAPAAEGAVDVPAIALAAPDPAVQLAAAPPSPAPIA